MTTSAPSNASSTRRKALSTLSVVFVLAGLAYAAWYFLVGDHHETTDNAYAQANVVQITPLVGGTVVAIHADDTDLVKAGQPLLSLDAADARVALEQAQAQLAQTVREVRTLYANQSGSQAQLAAREADVARVQNDVTRLSDDVKRREPLVATGAIGKEEFEHATAQLATARNQLSAAQAAVQAARDQWQASKALTDGTTVEQHPNVARAAARVREAHLALQRTQLVAPIDGQVARRSVQLGQRIQAGAPTMAVVALGDVWVDANFKESQLRRVRRGQPVTLTADVYGTKVQYHGKVAGLGAGTGAAFSLLPAQNATGNWIKIVQRVPVRVVLDKKELAEHPLVVGLSMEADVDVSQQDGAKLEPAAPAPIRATTQVFDAQDSAAQDDVKRIIQANLGR